jgi:hypothetical protein
MLVSVLGVAAACGDDGNTGQLADAPPQTVDARVAVDGAPGSDGAPGIDAAPGTDGPPPGATVTVTLGGVPAPGQTVYFQSHDSATTVTVVTGVDGVATSPVQAGDFVTVIDPLPPVLTALGPAAHLSTFAAVQPGDHLFVDVPVPATQGASVLFTINVPDEQQGYDYELNSTCGTAQIGRGAPPPIPDRRARRRNASAIVIAPVTNTVELFGCGGMADLLVVGRDGDGIARSWQYQPNVALIADGTVDIATLQPVADQSYTYTTVTGTSQVEVTRELRTARGFLYSASTTATFFDGNVGSGTLSMPTPDGVLAITTSTAELSIGFSQATVIEWGANTDYTLDFPATGLHPYTDVPLFDTPTHAITWPAAVDGRTPQLTLATVQTSRTDSDGDHTWTWDLVAPWSEGTVAYPVLPTTMFDFNPGTGDEPFVQRLTTASVPGGYDAARPRVFVNDLEGRVAGASGQVVFERVFVNRGELKNRTAPRGVRRVRPHAVISGTARQVHPR